MNHSCRNCGAIITKKVCIYCGTPKERKLRVSEHGIYDEYDDETPHPIQIREGQSQESFVEECADRWVDYKSMLEKSLTELKSFIYKGSNKFPICDAWESHSIKNVTVNDIKLRDIDYTYYTSFWSETKVVKIKRKLKKGDIIVIECRKGLIRYLRE